MNCHLTCSMIKSMLAFSPFLKRNLAITMTWWWPLSDELVYVSTIAHTHIPFGIKIHSRVSINNREILSPFILLHSIACFLRNARKHSKLKWNKRVWVGNQIWNCQIEMYWKRININKWTQYINLSLTCVKSENYNIFNCVHH